MTPDHANADPLRRLQGLLRELLQLDLSDLDFGIYRLLRLKREEVAALLDQQLPAAVDRSFDAASSEERAGVEAEVEELAERMREDVADDALTADGSVAEEYTDTKVKTASELIENYEAARARLGEIRTSDEQKIEVFNHLYAFFRRYYEDGDFVPKRRYGAREEYAVP